MTTTTHTTHYFDSQDDAATCNRGEGCSITRGEMLAEREARAAAATTRRKAPAKDAGAGSYEARLARNEHRRNRYARTGR